MLKVIDERLIGVNKTGRFRVVAAANPPEQAEGGWDLAPAMANRFMHLQWKCDESTFPERFLLDFPEPDLPDLGYRKENERKARMIIGTFLQSRRSLCHAMPRDEKASRAWPSPRMWEKGCLRVMTVYLDYEHKYGRDEDLLDMVLRGTVGDAAGMQLLEYFLNLDLPDPREILNDPNNAPILKQMDKMFVLLSEVIRMFVQDPDTTKWNNIFRYVERVLDEGAMRSDMVGWAVHDLVQFRLEHPEIDLPLPLKFIQKFREVRILAEKAGK